jgi:ketosteroid isomerase-like protein
MSQENVEVVQRLLEAIGRRDFVSGLACLHPHLEWIPRRAATEGTYNGHQGFEKFVADTDAAFEIFEPHFELLDVAEKVLAWGNITIRGTGSGVEMDVAAGGIFEFRDGLIARWQDYGSKQDALEAVGLSE